MSDILHLAERQVDFSFSSQMTIQWLQTLVQIARRHGEKIKLSFTLKHYPIIIFILGGLRSSLIIKAIRCSLSMNTQEGVSAAKKILSDGDVKVLDANIQLLRLKLLVAILDHNNEDANDSWLQLGTFYNLKYAQNKPINH